MTRLLIWLAMIAFLATATARAEEKVVAGLSQHSVSLTTSFSGSQLFVYGSVKRVAPADDETPLQVIVTITGPVAPVEVRKKERTTGIWINGSAVRVDSAPSFYAVATTGPIRDILSYTDELRYRIGLDHVIQLIDPPEWAKDEREDYRKAVARIRETEGLYSIRPGTVTLLQNELFETRIKLPADLIEGDYSARIFLLRDKSVIDVFEDKIEVRRAGIGRFIYASAQDYPALYGIVSILVALIAGWLASAFFRTFFPN